MPESVKISDLPEVSSVQKEDILPVVDSARTQTSQCTIEQIMNLGPGLNTISDEHVKNGNIPPGKLGFSARNRIAWSSSSSTDSPAINDNGVTRYQAAETSLTDFGRNLIGAADGTAARALINDSNEFSDGIYLQPGSGAEPAYSWINDRESGFYSDSPGSVSYSASQLTIWRLTADGIVSRVQWPTPTISSPVDYTADAQLIPGWNVTAYASLVPSAAGTLFTFAGHAAAIQRFGGPATQALNWRLCVGSLAADSSIGQAASPTGTTINQTNDKAVYVLNATTAASSPLYQILTAQGFTDIKASRHDPYHYSFTGVTTNYHSTADNQHRGLSTSTQSVSTTVNAPNKENDPWVGQISYRSAASNCQLLRHANILGVEVSANVYKFTFAVPMPDNLYCVLFGYDNPTASINCHMRVVEKAAGFFRVTFVQGTGTTFPSSVAGMKFDIVVVR